MRPKIRGDFFSDHLSINDHDVEYQNKMIMAESFNDLEKASILEMVSYPDYISNDRYEREHKQKMDRQSKAIRMKEQHPFSFEARKKLEDTRNQYNNDEYASLMLSHNLAQKLSLFGKCDYKNNEFAVQFFE